jgi:hypothetical protein
MKEYWGVKVRLHTFLTSALDGGETLTSHSRHFKSGKKSCTYEIGELVGPQLVLTPIRPEIYPGSIASEIKNSWFFSTWFSHYIGYAIPVLICNVVEHKICNIFVATRHKTC